MKTPIYLNPNIETVVVSGGGSATTTLIGWLARYRSTNHYGDRDGLKHTPLPPIPRSRGSRAIYVLGDPVHAVLSLCRRGYQYKQSQKLTRCFPWARKLPRDWGAYEIAASGLDFFAFHEHYLNWRMRFRTLDTLFVRSDCLFDSADSIIDFLGLPPHAVEDFPRRTATETSVNEQDAYLVASLRRTYSEFSSRIAELPSAEVVPASSLTSRYLLSPIYFATVGRQVASRWLPRVRGVVSGC